MFEYYISDLDLHLYEKHWIELVKLPIGKGSINYRIEYAIKEGKKIRNALANMNPKVRERLGICHTDNIGVVASNDKVNTGTDFILNHLDEPLFPRKIMTERVGVQVEIFDKQSVINHFKNSDYYDCRINAYSSLLQRDKGNF